MIVMNALANSLRFNGLTTGDVSAIYNNNFVPAGFTFSIWGLIYLWLLIFLIALMFGLFIKGKGSNVFNTKSIEINSQIAWWFTLSNGLNSVWIVFWHYLHIGLSLVIMLGLLITLIKIYKSINEIGKGLNNWQRAIFVKPFSLYLSWISVATIANTAAFLTKLEFENVIWVSALLKIEWPLTYLVIVVAAALAFVFIKKQGDYVYALVIAWALFGIAMRWLNEDSSQQLFETFLFTLIGAIIGNVVFYLFQKKRMDYSN